MNTLHTNNTGAATLNDTYRTPMAPVRSAIRHLDALAPAYPLPELQPARSEQGALHARAVALYTLRLRAGQRIDLSLGSSADVDIYVIDPLGQAVSCDNRFCSRKDCGIDVSLPGEYLVKLVNNANYRAEFRLCVHSRCCGSAHPVGRA